MIRHHLSDSLLMAYSAGDLAEAVSLVVATHVSMCDECRARLHSFDAMGGVVLDQTDAEPLGAGSLQATMARIRGQAPVSRIPAATRPAPRRAGLFPEPLARYAGGDVDAVRWRPVGGGVRQAILPTSRGATARLLRIPGGTAVPDHGHRGLELTLVLQGAFADESDRFGPGDIEIADEATNHTPVAEAGVDCICLAVTDAPLRFNALLPRVLQPFVRI